MQYTKYGIHSFLIHSPYPPVLQKPSPLSIFMIEGLCESTVIMCTDTTSSIPSVILREERPKDLLSIAVNVILAIEEILRLRAL